MIRGLARFAYRHLLSPGAKSTLRLWTVLDVPDRFPEVIGSFPEARVMVLAPHMDDEVVGCGGTLRMHALAGARVTIVFLTDGRAGDSGIRERCLTDAQVRRAEDELCERRKEESRRAGEVLGYRDLVFLDRPDGALRADAALRSEVAGLIERCEPELIYFPSPLDLHPDHWAASRLLAALAGDGAAALSAARCRAYEAWTPLLPNRLIDISAVFDAKLEALGKFTSQLEHVNYARTTTGLNAYRAMTRDGEGYWEAFYEGSAAQHAELVRRLDREM